MIIQNVLIFDAVNPEPYIGDIAVSDGKLLKVGGTSEPACGEEVIDGTGLRAYPGFVDAHSHMGLDSYGGATGGTGDYNEHGDFCCPQMRGMDSYNPMDPSVHMGLEGGVTTVGTGPGSANVLGGTFFAVKLYGNSVDEAAIKTSVAMKCAFGENPKRNY